MFPASLLSTLLLVLAVAANPVVVSDSFIRLPTARRFNTTNLPDLVRHNTARAKALRARGQARASGKLNVDAIVNEPVTNVVDTYLATIGVGSPATTYDLLVDTGSSNTWVGAGKAYVKTSTSVQTSNRVSVTYGSGSFSGTEFTDTVTIGSLVIPKQSIGVASSSSGFQGTDGIIGIGPVDLTLDTLSPATNSEIPTVTDNAFSLGLIPAHEIGISFEPTTTDSVTNGELTWGGTDSSKFTGSITFTPLTTVSPASEFWGINQSIKYGSTTLLSNGAGIVDTGTTLVLLATDVLQQYQSLTGAVVDSNTGLLRITSAQFANLQSLTYTIGGATFVLTANAQLWPRSLNTAIGGVAGDIYLIVGDIGNPSGEGFDFINGFGFLERFYSVFDTTNKRVGFATTPFTDATSN